MRDHLRDWYSLIKKPVRAHGVEKDVDWEIPLSLNFFFFLAQRKQLLQYMTAGHCNGRCACMYELKFLSLNHENGLILSQMFCDCKSVAVMNYSSEKLKTF